MKKPDLKGRLDPALIANNEYYGNARKPPNAHCWWESNSLLPGWYETISHQNDRLNAKIKARMSAKRTTS